MKKINLMFIRLRNFKGVRDLEFTFDGENANIYGANAAGKSTSVPDAFNWCMFGKNAAEQKQFGVRPIDSEGQKIKGVDTEVTVGLEIDGTLKTFSRFIKERKTNKTQEDGTKKAVITEEIKFFVDEVPMKAKEFDAEVASSVIDTETFKLLTNPNYFNEQLEWRTRRDILTKLVDDVSDGDVIASTRKLKDLPDLLQGKTVEQRMKQVKARKTDVKTEIDGIPHKIDELERQMPQTGDLTAERERAQAIVVEIDQLREQRANITSGAAIMQKKSELQMISNEITMHQQQFEQFSGNDVNALTVKLQEKRANLSIAQSKVSEIANKKASLERNVQLLENDKQAATIKQQEMGAEYHKLNATQFEAPETDCTCPTCKQDLPKEQIEAVKQTALEEFNLKRTTRLNELKQLGFANKDVMAQIDEKLVLAHQQLEQLTAQLQTAQADLTPHQHEIDKVQAQIESAQNNKPDITKDAKYIELQERKQAVTNELASLESHAAEAIQDIDKLITDLQLEKRNLDVQLASAVNAEALEQRIEELEEQERNCSAELEQLERIENLINLFNTTKANLLDERISGLFKYAGFKLYHEQINGGLKETCEVTYNGVPYNDLNFAMKLNVGIDICNTLQAHYGIVAPIVIDNRESVTNILETQAQVISLIVSPQDKELRVEVVKQPVAEQVEQVTLFDAV